MAENKYKKTTKRASTGGKTQKSTALKAAVGAVSAHAAVKAAKKTHPKTVAIVIISFILALAVGVGVCFAVNKNDVFEMNGSEYVILEAGEGYADEGVTVVEFVRDISDKVQVETTMRYENGKYYAKDGETDYYMVYTVNTLKFGKIYPVKKIRIITFALPTEQDAIDAVEGD